MEQVNVGKYIQIRRAELGLTQTELGSMVGKSGQVISNWERGYSTSMKLVELARLADALQVGVGYFFPTKEKAENQCPTVVDKRLQKVVASYPDLDDYTKDIIDAIIRVHGKKNK